MNPWSWYRSRRRWAKILIAGVGLPVALLLLYVAGRSLQYAAAEADAGLYVPTGANVVVRSRDLEAHLLRIQESVAWRALQRKILKDPVLRREINDLLKASGAPTLDDLEDERQVYARNSDRVLEVLAKDALLSAQVRESIPKAAFCAVVKLPWRYYLAAPLGSWFLPTESAGGTTVLRLRQGRQDYFIAFAGALALAANDLPYLEQALRRQGHEEEITRPAGVRLVFEGSPALLDLRKTIQDAGVFPYVRWETARGMTCSVDLREADLFVDAAFDRAQPLHETPPPHEVRSWAPLSTSGFAVTNTGGADLIAAVRGMIGTPGPKDVGAQTALQALQALDDGGLTSTFLPQLKDGMAVVTGVEEREGRAYSAFVLILPSRDPKAAVSAMNGLVRKIAGSLADSSYFETQPVGDSTMYSWRWPNSLQSMQMNDLLRPTYAAVKDMVVLGNNVPFTEAVIRAAEQGGGMEETSVDRKLKSRLKELGMGGTPTLAGGLFYPPVFRESLDGLLLQIAKQMVFATLNGPALRAEVEADLRRQGRPLSDAEIGPAYNAAVDAKIQAQEASLRRLMRPMDSVKWAAFDASTTPKGIGFRFVMELR